MQAISILVILVAMSGPPQPTIPAAIVGPAEVQAGEPAWFRIEAPAGYSVVWFPTDELQTGGPHIKDGSALFWTRTAGSYRLNGLQIDWDARHLQPLTHVVTVTGDTPPVPPDPPDPPDPPVPPDTVSGKVKAWTGEVGGGLAQVRKEAKALAEAYRELWQRIESKEFVVRENVPAELAKIHKEVLGARAAAWRPMLTRLATLFEEQESAGRLPTIYLIADLLAEVQRGWEAF